MLRLQYCIQKLLLIHLNNGYMRSISYFTLMSKMKLRSIKSVKTDELFTMLPRNLAQMYITKGERKQQQNDMENILIVN